MSECQLQRTHTHTGSRLPVDYIAYVVVGQLLLVITHVPLDVNNL